MDRQNKKQHRTRQDIARGTTYRYMYRTKKTRLSMLIIRSCQSRRVYLLYRRGVYNTPTVFPTNVRLLLLLHSSYPTMAAIFFQAADYS